MSRHRVMMSCFRLIISLLLSAAEATFPEPSYPWIKQGPSDQRSPCPALNSLANHGYIFRNGTDIPISLIAQAGQRVYSVAESTLLHIFNAVIQNGVTSGETQDGELTLTLSDLYPHNVVEHDASLTRKDEYFEPMAQFNAELLTRFFETNSTSDFLSLENVVFASQQRIIQSRLENPEASFAHNPILPIQMADEKLFVMLAGNDAALLHINKSAVEELFTYDRIPQGHLSRQDMGLEPVNLVDDDFARRRNDIAARLNETMFGPLPTTSNGVSMLRGGHSLLSITFMILVGSGACFC